MAALRHGGASPTAAIHHLQFTPEKVNPIKPISLVSNYSSSFHAKRTGRKNHLRQKNLRTLRKPIIPKLPLPNPILPIDSPPQEIEETGSIQEIQESEKSEISEAGNEEVKEFVELRETEGLVPSNTGVGSSVGKLANNSILKYGLWIVGAFLFQTVCAVWVFGGVDDKSEILKESGEESVKISLNGNGIGKMRLKDSGIGSFGYVDELEMERKIEEIRLMAREARETERLESKRGGVGSEDSEEVDGGKYFKSGIEEEVDNRLIKLRKKLGNKMPVISVGYSGKGSERRDGVEKVGFNDGESNGALLFKKKHKFKSLLGDDHLVEKPMGFGSDGNSIENVVLEKENELFSNGNVDDNVVDQMGIDGVHVVEEDSEKEISERTESTKNTRKKVGKGRRINKQETGKVVAKPKMVDGSTSYTL